MLEILTIVLFCWLFFKAIGLALRMAWGTAKIIASLLFIIAVPLLFVCLAFAGGLLILLPLLLAGLAFSIGVPGRKIPCKENRIGLQWY